MRQRFRASELAMRLLDGVDPDARRTIVAASEKRPLRKSQVIYRMGDPASELFVLTKGRAQLGRPTRTGRDVLMGILVPGDVFGLVSLVAARTSYMGTAEALEAGEAMVWDRSAIQRFARKHPQLSGNALHVALTYVARFAERHELLIAATADQRLARALTRLGTQSGQHSGFGVEVRINNDQLAALADVSSFTTCRVLKKWERRGAVAKSRGRVQILAPDKLLSQ